MVNGEGPSPRLVISAVQALPDDCMTAALMSGGRHNFGWGTDRHLAASMYDAVNQNTIVSGNWKKPPKIPLWPRPKGEKKKKKPTRKASVADLYARFNEMKG